ncbi:hypothetical protein AAEO56_13200 [Flavobacterium sp. DGU11]|uniref:Uncharacterized protein n=1 Tax=Flavobacterium arundinis TaxID=3139143 RepID=A0ABU9I0A0_9FLAO
MKKIIFFVAVLFFTCFSVIAQDGSILFCRDGNKTVRLEFETGFPYLKRNKPTRLKIYVENIDLKESAVVGKGIRPLGNSHKDEFFLCSVTVNRESVVDGKF